MDRAAKRLVELELAAMNATDSEEVKRILAEEMAIRAAIEPSRVDRVAHTLFRIALNPDKLRAFLIDLEPEMLIELDSATDSWNA
jgi:hypothetical protein